MISVFSTAFGYSYKKFIKPILFKFSPDSVHTNTTKLGKFVSKIPPILWLLRTTFSYQNEPLLGQTVGGIYYQNPVGLSAGFDKNFELLKLMPSLGFGFVEGGSLTYQPSGGNPRPHYYRLKQSRSILVNAGLNNDGVSKIISRLQKYGDIGYPLNISVAKTNSPQTCSEVQAINDYISSLKAIKKSGVGSTITINISCPNAYGGEPFTTPSKLEKLLTAIDELKLQQPVQVKMPIDLDWDAFDGLLQVITKHNVYAVTIGNLAKSRQNPYLVDEISAEQKGNMSGKPTYDLSNKLIHQTYQKYGDKLVIIGVGGIFSANDAYKKIKHGASLVELITGFIFEGPQLIGQINKGLAELAIADGYTNISQAVGASHNRK